MAYVDQAHRFNPASPVFQDNLHNVYHYMRNHQPVARIGKKWVLTRYQDVFQALKERAFISSGIPEDLHAELKKERLSLSPPLQSLLYGIVLFEDGGVNREHSLALQALFTGGAWGALTDLVSRESHSLMAELTITRAFDGISQVAAPLWGKLFTAWLRHIKRVTTRFFIAACSTGIAAIEMRFLNDLAPTVSPCSSVAEKPCALNRHCRWADEGLRHPWNFWGANSTSGITFYSVLARLTGMKPYLKTLRALYPAEKTRSGSWDSARGRTSVLDNSWRSVRQRVWRLR